MPYTTTTTVTDQQISDVICSGVEGGIAYWAESFLLNSPGRETLSERPWYADPALYGQPFSVTIVQHEEHKQGAGRNVILDNAAIQRGLDWCAQNRPDVISDMMAEEGDADTGDTFIQACVFGEIVYG